MLPQPRLALCVLGWVQGRHAVAEPWTEAGLAREDGGELGKSK